MSTTTRLVENVSSAGDRGWSIQHEDGAWAETHKGLPTVYTDLPLAQRAAQLVEAGEIGDRARTAAGPCGHVDFDTNGICYGCGELVARPLVSYL